MKYEVKFTNNATLQLRSISLYIYEKTQSKLITSKFILDIKDTISVLELFPTSGALPNDRVLISMGYRFLIYDNYLIFYIYKEIEKTSYILSIINAKQDYKTIIKKIL